MVFTENLRCGLGEIRAHKLRSFLTLIGVILGVLSVNLMFSLVGGIQEMITVVFDELGLEGLIFISHERPDSPVPWPRLLAGRMLTLDDVDYLAGLPDLDGLVVPVVTFEREAEVDGERFNVKFEGVGEELPTARKLEIGAGRFLARADMLDSNLVCVVGHKLSEEIFEGQEPLGKEIVVGGERLTVVGVLAKPDFKNANVHAGNIDIFGEVCYLPVTTAMHRFMGSRRVHYLMVKIFDEDRLGSALDEIKAALRHRRRGVEDFRTHDVGESILESRNMIDEMLRNWNIVLGTIAGVSLLIGGIGILSVMLISINERLFAIGIRKACGATDIQIFGQFLVESMVLSLVGGLIGSGAAVGILKVLAPQFKYGLVVSLGGLALGLFFALATGAAFGTWPAWRASRLQPVEALTSPR